MNTTVNTSVLVGMTRAVLTYETWCTLLFESSAPRITRLPSCTGRTFPLSGRGHVERRCRILFSQARLYAAYCHAIFFYIACLSIVLPPCYEKSLKKKNKYGQLHSRTRRGSGRTQNRRDSWGERLQNRRVETGQGAETNLESLRGQNKGAVYFRFFVI